MIEAFLKGESVLNPEDYKNFKIKYRTEIFIADADLKRDIPKTNQQNKEE